MNIEFNRIRRTFILTFVLLAVIAVSSIFALPYKTAVLIGAAAILLAAALYQFIYLERIRKVFDKTGEILTRSNERNFSALHGKEDHIISHEISSLIEQLEDSVKQTENILKERDILAASSERCRSEQEEMNRRLNGDILSLKNRIGDSADSLEKIIGDMNTVSAEWGRGEEILERMEILYNSYRENYDMLNEAISRSREISSREIERGEALGKKMLRLLDRTETGEERMQTIIKGIENIRDVTDIINDVAEKASILSLNAAIESAHAGEAGKGFAVVAEEVKVLADTTSEHAEYINEALYSVSDFVADSKSGEEEGDSLFSGLTGEVGEMVEGFKAIRELLLLLDQINKPEQFADREKGLKTDDLADRSSLALRKLKDDLDICREETGMLSLIRPDSSSAAGKEPLSRLPIHETAVKTVREEDLSEELE